MTVPAVIFTILAGFFLLILPRQWAAVPLLIGAAYMSMESSLDVGALHFTSIRILVAVGILRVIVRGERIAGGLNMLDRVLVAWAVWAVCSSCFHKDFSAALIYRLGLAFNVLGFYLLVRVFIQDADSLLRICKVIIIALLPIAFGMILEARTGKNLFSLFGGVPELSEIRGGKVRAQGPFDHAILAGTVGAVCLPMAVLFWKSNRKLALLGLAATGLMVLTSRSSGPVMTAFFTVFGLVLWRYRTYMRLIRWCGILAILALAMVMNAPVYFILDRIDLTGSSTGWHRAALIQGAISHVDDWWLGGTDYTRDWTPEAGYDENNTDITNHYIRMAVWGGLPMLLLFVWSLVIAFGMVAKVLRTNRSVRGTDQFLMWTLGCVLFGHVAAMVSVSYFDQSVFYLYFVLAAIATAQTVPVPATEVEFEREQFVDSSSGHEANLCHHR
jgi:hypothetical protein